jgi:hypothetical protein
MKPRGPPARLRCVRVTQPGTHGEVEPSAVETPDPPQAAAGEWKSGFVAHEWGTFTAVADASGTLVDWRPLLGPSDLPSFVYTQAEDSTIAGKSYKGALPAAIRMETPVIYFYSDEPRSIDVKVVFSGGTITEWYPAANKGAGEDLLDVADWGRVDIVPGADETKLRVEASESHYYPARETDAALVKRGDETEKFLFYRGVGHFALRVNATVVEDAVEIRNGGEASSLPFFVVHSRGGKVGFVSVEGVNARVRIPAADGDVEALADALRTELVRSGLYGREADAMIATWRDYWFEDDGVRLFYLMDSNAVEARLPLTIEPKPEEVVRTIVGRIELMTPELRAEAQSIVDEAASAKEACTTLRNRHGRFADPLSRDLVGQRADAVRLCLGSP